MATYITGRDLTLTIDGDSYDAQASTVTLAMENTTTVGDVLSGEFQKTVKNGGSLSVEMFADWGAAGSLCDALFDAAKTAPDTALTASFDANGSTFTCSVYPAFPSAGGGAADVLTTTVELRIPDGSIARS
jgi:hypothetical protein